MTTTQSTLIELSKRLSEIESTVGRVDGESDSSLTLESRAKKIRTFLKSFRQFLDKGTSFF
jgi:hypothetical protein